MSSVLGRELGDATLRELREALRGELVLPEDAAYDEARSVWNGMIDRRPALIARCSGTDDVIEAIRFARSEGLEVAVRGGGHNVAGNATCDGGLVIDLSPMKGVRVDTEATSVRAQGGLTWRRRLRSALTLTRRQSPTPWQGASTRRKGFTARRRAEATRAAARSSASPPGSAAL